MAAILDTELSTVWGICLEQQSNVFANLPPQLVPNWESLWKLTSPQPEL